MNTKGVLLNLYIILPEENKTQKHAPANLVMILTSVKSIQPLLYVQIYSKKQNKNIQLAFILWMELAPSSKH